MTKLKVPAFIIAFTIFSTCFCAVNAAGKSDGWSIKCFGEAAESGYAEVVGDETLIYDGELTLKMSYKASAVNENNYIEVKNMLNKDMPSGRYTLKFYNKANFAPTTQISVSDAVICGVNDMTSKAVDAPSGVSGWKEYTYTFDYVQQEESFLAFRVYSRTTSQLIDNVSITEEGSNYNYVSDGGFEDYYNSTEPEEYDTTDYRPTCIMAAESDGMVVLNWRNPVTKELKKIAVYDITDGKEKLLGDDVTHESGQTVWYKIEGLETGKKYQYKIVFSFDKKEDAIYFLSASPKQTSSYNMKGWSFYSNRSGAAGYCPGSVKLDYNEAHSGNASVKIMSNIDNSLPEFKSNIYVDFTHQIPMVSGTKYKISFWVKRNNVQRAVQAHMSWANFDDQKLTFDDMKGSGDWEKREYTYVYSDKNTITFLMDGMCEGLWFDDITVFELDDEGNNLGENLLPEGDFESIYSDKTESVSNLTATAQIGGAKLSWKNPSKNYNGMEIYQEVFGKYEYRGTINAGTEEINISGLNNGTSYKYKLVPFNNDGFYGEESEISFTTVMPKYEIAESILYKDGVKTEALSGSGKYSIALPIKNNLYEDGLKCVQLAAVYKNNTLEKLYSSEMTIPQNGKENVVTEFEIPEGEGYCVQIFVIDSRNEWNTLCPMVNYN